MILSGQSIRARGILIPCSERGVYGGKSFGLSAASYDVRTSEYSVVYPGQTKLVSVLERIEMPDDVLGMVCNKSTWMRLGLLTPSVVIDPGWKGHLSLLMHNTSDKMLVIAPGSPLAQVVFHLLDQDAEKPYSGKYQNQEQGPQGARWESETTES